MAIHYCDKCGKKMERTAKCEFNCEECDNTILILVYSMRGKIQKNSIRLILNLLIFVVVEI